MIGHLRELMDIWTKHLGCNAESYLDYAVSPTSTWTYAEVTRKRRKYYPSMGGRRWKR